VSQPAVRKPAPVSRPAPQPAFPSLTKPQGTGSSSGEYRDMLAGLIR
jgi:hypothetical protein